MSAASARNIMYAWMCQSLIKLPYQNGCTVGCNEHEEVGEKEGKDGNLENSETLWKEMLPSNNISFEKCDSAISDNWSDGG